MALYRNVFTQPESEQLAQKLYCIFEPFWQKKKQPEIVQSTRLLDTIDVYII